MVRADDVLKSVQELSLEVSDLRGRVVGIDKTINTVKETNSIIQSDLKKLTNDFSDIKTRLAVLETLHNELKIRTAETDRRKAAMIPPLFAAIIGGIITLLGQLLIQRLFPS